MLPRAINNSQTLLGRVLVCESKRHDGADIGIQLTRLTAVPVRVTDVHCTRPTADSTCSFHHITAAFFALILRQIFLSPVGSKYSFHRSFSTDCFD